MDNKWAIYFHDNKFIFIRSWLREVFVIASTIEKDGNLIITNIEGKFTENESNEFTKSGLEFLIHSHALNEVVPAPLPKNLIKDTDKAGLWSFSLYGNMAHYGHFEDSIKYEKTSNLRSHSLLHIAIAKGDLAKIDENLEKGVDIDLIAGDGLTTLQWALVCEPKILEYLLEKGANPDQVSLEGATALMNAVQGSNLEHIELLIKYKADVNKQDSRGFTALHRAAEMGKLEMLKVLLKNGADKNLQAEGHTAISLAKLMNHSEIIAILENY